jgi:predicted nucleic acid-binding protein
MIAYLESSALAKQFLREEKSSEVSLLIENVEAVATSIISRVEVSAALSKAARMQWTTIENAKAALRSFRRQWADMPTVEINEAVVSRADDFAWEFGLRGYDAVHLASAVAFQDSLGQAVMFASFDKDLRKAAKEMGLDIWPE